MACTPNINHEPNGILETCGAAVTVNQAPPRSMCEEPTSNQTVCLPDRQTGRPVYKQASMASAGPVSRSLYSQRLHGYVHLPRCQVFQTRRLHRVSESGCPARPPTIGVRLQLCIALGQRFCSLLACKDLYCPFALYIMSFFLTLYVKQSTCMLCFLMAPRMCPLCSRTEP